MPRRRVQHRLGQRALPRRTELLFASPFASRHPAQALQAFSKPWIRTIGRRQSNRFRLSVPWSAATTRNANARGGFGRLISPIGLIDRSIRKNVCVASPIFRQSRPHRRHLHQEGSRQRTFRFARHFKTDSGTSSVLFRFVIRPNGRTALAFVVLACAARTRRRTHICSLAWVNEPQEERSNQDLSLLGSSRTCSLSRWNGEPCPPCNASRFLHTLMKCRRLAQTLSRHCFQNPENSRCISASQINSQISLRARFARQ